MLTDKELKELEKRLQEGKVSAGSMKNLVPHLLAMLKTRTKQVAVLNHFVREVAEGDVLYTPATDVWRRKDAGKHSVEWVRANVPVKFQNKG